MHCGKQGHLMRQCIFNWKFNMQQEPSSPEKKWVMDLLNRKRNELPSRTQTITEILQNIKTQGEILNKHNPWAYKSFNLQKKDSLSANLGFWKAIGTSNLVLTWLAFGVPLTFVTTPNKSVFRNALSAYEHMKKIDEQICKHVADGSYEKISKEQAIVISPLSVAESSSGKVRDVWDGRFVNAHLPHYKFKLETLKRNAGVVIQKGMKQITVDLEKAYFHLKIRSKDRKYLCFEWRGTTYQCNILMLGLSIAPLVFHKTVRQIVRFMRSIGISLINYIDDFWFGLKGTAKQQEDITAFIREIITMLGWKYNGKCSWEPKHISLFLGLLIDTESMLFSVPEEKRLKALLFAQQLFKAYENNIPVTVKQLQQFTGTLISLSLAIPAARVMTRDIYAQINKETLSSGYSRTVYLRLDYKSAEELRFWCRQLQEKQSNLINDPLTSHTIHSDSSDLAFGYTLDDNVRKWNFLPWEIVPTSSTQRELYGIVQALQDKDVSEIIKGKCVEIKMDSLPAIRNLIKGGGPVKQLCSLVKQFWRLTDKLNVFSIFTWIPREQNTTADELSKSYQTSAGWPINTHHLKKLARYLSVRMNVAECSVSVLCPSPSLIVSVVGAVRRNRKSLILIHPLWEAASWWNWVNGLASSQLPITNVARLFENTSKTPPWPFVASLIK